MNATTTARQRWVRQVLAAFSWLTLLGGAAFAAAAPQAGPVPAYEARYQASRYGMEGGLAVQTLGYPQPGAYRLEVSVEPTGVVTLFTQESIREVSTGRVGGDGALLTDRYEHRRSGGRDRHRDYRFDRQAAVLHDAAGGVADQALPDGLHDDLTQLEALRGALGKGAETFDVTALYAGKGRVMQYRYRRSDETRRIETPAGTVEAVRVTRTDQRGKERLELWCAPALHHLPVRIERFRKNRFQAALELTAYRDATQTLPASAPGEPGAP